MPFVRPHAMRPARVLSRLTLAFAAVSLAACQSLPAEEVSQAHAMIASATLASLGDAAAPELVRSRQKLALAHRWIDARDYGPARWLAEQAEVDAELALARQASEQARMAVATREQARDTHRVTWQRP